MNLHPYHRGRLYTLEAIQVAKTCKQWTALKRATWLRDAIRLRHLNRDVPEYRAYYAGKIAVLKSRMSAPGKGGGIASKIRCDETCPTWTDQKLVPDRKPLRAPEMATTLLCCSAVTCSLCWLTLAWLSPILAMLLSLAIGVVVSFLIEGSRDDEMSEESEQMASTSIQAFLIVPVMRKEELDQSKEGTNLWQ